MKFNDEARAVIRPLISRPPPQPCAAVSEYDLVSLVHRLLATMAISQIGPLLARLIQEIADPHANIA
eukprot:6104589-Karenia_brevis.AAC.1